jgi:hypothetical protein
MRDEFDSRIKDTLARRVGYRCSNPDCQKATSGPHSDPLKVLNVGVAAHITAAALGGPRYDGKLSSAERKSINNAIWLCQICAKLVDNDPQRYSTELLRAWKAEAEQRQLLEVERPLILLPKHVVSGRVTRRYRFFDKQSRYVPTFSDLLDQDSKKFLNMLDTAKRRADDVRLRVQATPLDDQRSRTIQDYIFRIYKDIWFIQRKWVQVNGRYFQGKTTMPKVPLFEQDGQVDFGFGLTDQVDDWIDVGYIDEYAPVQLECHVYEGPKGQGFTVYARVQVDEQVWTNQMHYGPEEYRDAYSFLWAEGGKADID